MRKITLFILASVLLFGFLPNNVAFTAFAAEGEDTSFGAEFDLDIEPGIVAIGLYEPYLGADLTELLPELLDLGVVDIQDPTKLFYEFIISEFSDHPDLNWAELEATMELIGTYFTVTLDSKTKEHTLAAISILEQNPKVEYVTPDYPLIYNNPTGESPVPTAPALAILLGDMNLNDQIDILDVDTIYTIYLYCQVEDFSILYDVADEFGISSPGEVYVRADVNQDGFITIADVDMAYTMSLYERAGTPWHVWACNNNY